MADVEKLIDPDGGTGYDYLSLNAFEAGEDGGSNAGDDLFGNCQASAGSADTTATSYGGFTYDSVTTRAVADHEAIKTGYASGRYRLETTGGNTLSLNVDVPLVFDGIQIKNSNQNQYAYVVFMSNATAAETVTFRNSRIVSAGANANRGGVRNADTDITLALENTIIEGFNYFGLYATGGDTSLLHSIIYGNGSSNYGFSQTSGTCVATNSAVFNTANDFNGTITITNCASDDGDGTGAVAPSGSDWTNEYGAPSTGDWTIQTGGNCYHGGTTGTGVSTDIEGDTYDASTPSIGVDEYSAGGGVTLTVNALDHAMAFDSPTLTQRHNITIADMAHTMAFDAPTLTQRHNMTVADMAHAMAFDAPTLVQKHNLSVDDMTHAMAFDAISALVQKHYLIVADTAHTMTFDVLNLAGQITLVVNDMTHAVAFDSAGALVQAHVLAVDDMGHAVALDSVTLSQRHMLALQDMAHAMGFDSITFPTTAAGPVNVTFSGTTVMITFAGSVPAVAFSGSQPIITFEGN